MAWCLMEHRDIFYKIWIKQREEIILQFDKQQ
jgi:hypothetical protein